MSLLRSVKLDKNPIIQFSRWFEDAQKWSEMEYPEAMCFSNINKDGYPDSRILLLKQFDEKGFVFYTNKGSPKGKSLEKIPYGCMTFYWSKLKRQVRIQGTVEPISEKESDDYFASRPRLSQLGAWASVQSTELKNRMILIKKVGMLFLKYIGKPVPRPSFWGGYRLIPQKIEFWQDQKNRLHDRFCYTRNKDGSWDKKRLFP